MNALLAALHWLPALAVVIAAYAISQVEPDDDEAVHRRARRLCRTAMALGALAWVFAGAGDWIGWPGFDPATRMLHGVLIAAGLAGLMLCTWLVAGRAARRTP